MPLPHVSHLVLLAVALALLPFVLFALRAAARWRRVPRGAWIELELKGALSDLPPVVPLLRRVMAARTAPPPASVQGLRRLGERLAKDPRVTGVVLRVGELSCGWATAQSVRDVIAKLRADGKHVVAYMPYGGGSRELFVALAAEKIYTVPQANLGPLGLASGANFYRTLLARGGIEAEILARREFKSAAESFTRDGYSDENRMQMTALLDTIHRALVDAIAKARGRTDEDARAIIDEGALLAKRAVERGLIDGVAYDDELATRLRTVDGRAEGRPLPIVRAARYAAAAMGRRWFRGPGARVGVVEIRGPIVAESPMAFGRVADSKRIVAALRVARASSHVGAVVLYIDSPGGSALASDLIAREVDRLREKKPVVAYFADTAASGGYYVGALAHEIVAQPVTVTGSIGVIAMRFVLERALEKLGVHHEVIRRGARADINSPYRHWTDDERAVLDGEIDAFYSEFVGIVARGRKRPFDEVEKLARGRIWSGADAQGAGLVDTLGGLDVALARARALAKGPMGKDMVIVHPPRSLPEPPEPPAPLQPLVAMLGPRAAFLNLATACERERVFAYEDRV